MFQKLHAYFWYLVWVWRLLHSQGPPLYNYIYTRWPMKMQIYIYIYIYIFYRQYETTLNNDGWDVWIIHTDTFKFVLFVRHVHSFRNLYFSANITIFWTPNCILRLAMSLAKIYTFRCSKGKERLCQNEKIHTILNILPIESSIILFIIQIALKIWCLTLNEWFLWDDVILMKN